jgi:hypothetical protein
MNNTTKKKRTTTLTAIAAVILMAATIVVGGSIAATSVKSAFAASNNSGNTVTAQINSQSATQSGFDNTQEQEAQNTICTHPGNNASCVSENAAAAAVVVVPAVKKTCEQCFTSLLTPDQISMILIDLQQKSIPDLCALLAQPGISLIEDLFRQDLSDAGVSGTTANELIACLRDAGVVFT